MPTCRWYSLYSEYFPAVISSVSQVDPWKRATRLKPGINVQAYDTSAVTMLQTPRVSQMLCSAAKLGCLLHAHRPEVIKPRFKSSSAKPCGTLPVAWYSLLAFWKSASCQWLSSAKLMPSMLVCVLPHCCWSANHSVVMSPTWKVVKAISDKVRAGWNCMLNRIGYAGAANENSSTLWMKEMNVMFSSVKAHHGTLLWIISLD